MAAGMERREMGVRTMRDESHWFGRHETGRGIRATVRGPDLGRVRDRRCLLEPSAGSRGGADRCVGTHSGTLRRPLKDAAAEDVLIFTNGDQLSGKLLRGVNDTVVFHSDMAGDITVPLAKVKELRTAGEFAVLKHGAPVAESRAVKPQQIAVTAEGVVDVAGRGWRPGANCGEGRGVHRGWADVREVAGQGGGTAGWVEWNGEPGSDAGAVDAAWGNVYGRCVTGAADPGADVLPGAEQDDAQLPGDLWNADDSVDSADDARDAGFSGEDEHSACGCGAG